MQSCIPHVSRPKASPMSRTAVKQVETTSCRLPSCSSVVQTTHSQQSQPTSLMHILSDQLSSSTVRSLRVRYGSLKCCLASALILCPKPCDWMGFVGRKNGFSIAFKYASWTSLKNARTESSPRPSCRSRKRIWAAVTNADTCNRLCAVVLILHHRTATAFAVHPLFMKASLQPCAEDWCHEMGLESIDGGETPGP